jgi:hypothetical protein
MLFKAISNSNQYFISSGARSLITIVLRPIVAWCGKLPPVRHQMAGYLSLRAFSRFRSAVGVPTRSPVAGLGMRLLHHRQPCDPKAVLLRPATIGRSPLVINEGAPLLMKYWLLFEMALKSISN